MEKDNRPTQCRDGSVKDDIESAIMGPVKGAQAHGRLSEDRVESEVPCTADTVSRERVS